MEQIAVLVSRQYNSVPSELSIVSAQSKRNSVTIPIATASRPLGYSVGVHFKGFCLLVVVTQGGEVMHGGSSRRSTTSKIQREAVHPSHTNKV